MPKVTLPHVSESVEQISLFHWATWLSGTYPVLNLMHHIPNGGKRDKATAKRLKAEGVKAGVPDICLPCPSGGFHGLYIELKAGKNKTTDYQDEWLEALSKQGYKTAVCYGWEQASEVILNYIKGAGANATHI